jgi:tetratricopeptide (TPR) repeat protein
MPSAARIDELRKKFDENPRRYFAPLANEYRKLGDLEQAIFICQEYLPQQPGHMSGHIVYGQALFESARHDEARGVFETALAMDPENIIALRHLGDIARLAGQAHAAREWYLRVLDSDPRNEEIAALLAKLPPPPPALFEDRVEDPARSPGGEAAWSQDPAVPTSMPETAESSSGWDDDSAASLSGATSDPVEPHRVSGSFSLAGDHDDRRTALLRTELAPNGVGLDARAGP